MTRLPETPKETPGPDAPFHLQYRVPAVRHLAWMCHAPQLINASNGFHPAAHVCETTLKRLSAWDNTPDNGPAVLTEPPARRLGHYFEALYECLLRDLLGWDILLKNQPVRSGGLTLGELDFMVRNPADQGVEHHEIAVKFYLGYQDSRQDTPLWYGPNSKDRLDLKSERLRSHQSRLTERPETRVLLDSLNIPRPARTTVYMPGYLFYPQGEPLASPENVPVDHLRGQWLNIDELDARSTDQAQTPIDGAWIPLQKPHWLGPWSQRDKPDRQQTEEALAMVRSAGIPRLFAVLRESPESGHWTESSRVFVVPRGWPHC